MTFDGECSNCTMNYWYAEIKLYEILGVKSFRNLVFEVESVKHSKDKRKNVNYHLREYTINAVENFIGCILYNTIVHLFGLFMVIAYILITHVFNIRIMCFDVLIIIFTVFNMYSIMLQRYNYIRLRKIMNKLRQVINNNIDRQSLLLERCIQSRDFYELQDEFELIMRIHESLEQHKDFVLSESDAIVLRRIANSAKNVVKSNRLKKQGENNKEKLCQIKMHLPRNPLVIDRIERRISIIQNLFKFDNRENVLFGFCIITETSECERAYRELFSCTSRESLEFTLEVLLRAYNYALFNPESNMI